MPALLTAASSMTCPHGGTVIATPASTRAVVDAPILTAGDSFTIAGCTFQVAGAPSPCVSINWVQTAQKLKHGGALALNAGSVGLCLAGTQAPQGTVLIGGTQARVSGL